MGTPGKPGDPQDAALCPRYHAAVELIGRRWTGAILFLLLRGPTRYSDLRDAIPGITDPMLSARLQELEGEGVVERSVLPGTPVRVQYALTAKGSALGDVIGAVREWSDEWGPSPKPAAPAPGGRSPKTQARRPASRNGAANGPARRVRAAKTGR